MPHAIQPRPAIGDLAASKIREVANSGMGRADLLPFWFGEPDQETPGFIRDAAVAALAAGDVFYTSNFGIPLLRDTIARYVSGLHRPVDADRVVVTSSGVSALMIANQALFGPGDRVVVVTPVWPNLVEAPRILGAEVVRVSLRPGMAHGHLAWTLDTDALLAALRPGTRGLILNSPNNPTGWVIEAGQQQAILEHCRRHGIWILADDVYERLAFDAPGAAPSFLDIADPEDRLVSANSFSKSWLMTGWRLGWLVSPRGADGATLVDTFGKLIEYNTSCAPGFVQRAGVVAIEQGEATVAATRTRLRTARDHLCARLADIPGVTIPRPDGAMYVFFSLAAGRDSLALCKRLVAEAGLGLAPGAAFGQEGEGYLRWCIASSVERLDEGVLRLQRFLASFEAPRQP